MNAILKHIALACFIGILLVKLSAFHIYEHHGTADVHDHHCELCLLTLDSQQEAAALFSLGHLQKKTLPEKPEAVIPAFDFQIVLEPFATDLFSRPPPLPF